MLEASSNFYGMIDSILSECVQAEIPHVEEHVSKIDFVGVQTQSKLLDISAAANAMGISCINAVHNSVTTGTAITCVTSSSEP